MYIYKKLVAISILSLSMVGCGSSDIDEIAVSQHTPFIEQENIEQENIEQDKALEMSTTYIHDAGYTQLIHNDFPLKFQTLMEQLYSRINYNVMGINIEEITLIDESAINELEEMTENLDPIQDEKILSIMAETRLLFDEVNEIINVKTYEKLWTLDDRGQTLYNQFYDWLIEAASNHTH